MNRKLIGYVMVDSGQIFITDPAYLSTWTHGEYSEGVEPDNSYARVTTFMFDHGGYGEVEQGISVLKNPWLRAMAVAHRTLIISGSAVFRI